MATFIVTSEQTSVTVNEGGKVKTYRFGQTFTVRDARKYSAHVAQGICKPVEQHAQDKAEAAANAAHEAQIAADLAQKKADDLAAAALKADNVKEGEGDDGGEGKQPKQTAKQQKAADKKDETKETPKAD